MRKAMDEFKELRAGAADLFHPRVLLIAVVLSAVYLLIAGTGLFMDDAERAQERPATLKASGA